MGRKCAVPHCYTGYRKCTEKAALYKVPDDDFFLSKWQDAIAREDRPINPKDYVCEKHFKDDDILRKRIRKDIVENYQRPRLKPDAIPSIFPDLPEFILKMTKKRRKVNVPVPDDMTVNIDLEKIDEPLEIKEENEDDRKENENGGPKIDLDEIEIKTELEEDNTASIGDKEEYDPTGAKLHHCDSCSYKTKFSHNLRTHKVKHLSGEDAYMICEFCINYKTKWEITYVNHMKSKHGIILKEYFKCPFCTFKTKNKFFFTKHCENEHDNEEIILKMLKCEFDGCDYRTESQALLKIHSLTHDNFQVEMSSNIRTFSCKECAFKSNCKGTLDTHLKSCHKADDTGEIAGISKSTKPELFCKECYFKTSSKNALTKHTNSAHNTGAIEEIPIILKKTLETNLTPSTLHTKAVIKQKAILKCSRCPYKSHSEEMLEKHLSKHQMLLQTTTIQQINRLQCTKCSFVTFSKSSLEDHQQNSFHCVECEYVTKNKSEHIIHTLTHRNVSVEEVKNASHEGSCGNSNKRYNDISAATDFCLVTIKEERDDLSMEES